MFALRHVGSVDLVVACHDCPGSGVTEGNLEWKHVDLPQCAGRDDNVDTNSFVLLVVCNPMLDGGDDASRLDTVDVCSRQLSCGVGILGHGLEAAAAKG